MIQIPSDRVIWLALIAVAGILLIFGLYKSYKIRIQKGDTFIDFDRPAKTVPPLVVDVGVDGKIADSTLGNVTGYQTSGENIHDGNPVSNVDVLRNAEIRNSELGDIVGVSHRPDPPGKQEASQKEQR